MDMDLVNKKREKVITPYEVGQTAQFSTESAQAIIKIFNEYLLVMSSELSLQLRTSVKVNLDNVYEQSYGKFIENLGEVTMLGIYNFLPVERPLFVQIDPMFGFLLVDNLCGGSIAHEQIDREITNLDKRLVLNFLTSLLERFERHWLGVIPGARMGFMVIETSPLFYHTIPESDAVYTVDVGVNFNDKHFTIKYAFPYLTIGESLIEYVKKRNSDFASIVQTEKDKDTLEQTVYSAEVELSAILGKTNITLKELSDFKVGDVVVLNQNSKDAIDFQVAGETRYKVRSGIQNKKFVVKIENKVENKEV